MTSTHEHSDLRTPPTDARELCAEAGGCARFAPDRRTVLRGAAAAGSAVLVGAGLSGCGHILEPNENVADGAQSGDAMATGTAAPSAMSSAAAKPMSNGSGGSMDASKMPAQNPMMTPGHSATMAPAMPSGTLLGMASQIPVGGGVVFAGHQVVVTQPKAGTYKAFSSVCTHAGCQCNDVSSGMINCPCHGASFSISDGSAVQGPTRTPLPTRTVTVANGEVRLQA